MSHIVTCDGCSCVIDGRPNYAGNYLQVEYCPGCAKLYKEILEAEDVFLKAAADQVRVGLGEARAKVLKAHDCYRAFKLPDGGGYIVPGGSRALPGHGGPDSG